MEQATPTAPGAVPWKIPVLAAALLGVVAAGLTAWFMPRPLGDLFMALAGGRDVLAGSLGRPDDWAFTTGSRVWINQSWGSHVVLYAVHGLAGYPGLFVFKAVLLTGIAGSVALAGRVRGAAAPTALIAVGAAFLASPQGFVLRPSLFTFLFLPLHLYLLYRSRGNRRWLWGVVLLIAVWANVHGAFLAGLGILGLWTLVHVLASLRTPKTAVSRAWPEAAALAAALAAAVFLNPFGIKNLTLPLEVLDSDVWKSVMEWRPVFDKGPVKFDLPWVFFAMAGMIVVLGAVRLAALLRHGRIRSGENKAAVGWFEVLLTLTALGLSLSSRRFIPLAAVLLAPLLAQLLTWIWRSRPLAVPVLLAAVSLPVVAVLEYGWIVPYYQDDNPLRPRETIFERSVNLGTHFPEGAAEFLVANDLEGRVFHEWRWEGYLRWKAPKLRLFMGGRAQQVYDEDTWNKRQEILSARSPQAELAALDVHLAVVPLDLEYAWFCQQLLVAPGEPAWAYIYCDARTAVLADTASAKGKRWVQEAANARFQYPDPGTAALSRAMCLASPASGRPLQSAVTALEAAVSANPVHFVYSLLADRAKSGGVDPGQLTGYLEGQYQRLLGMDTDSADGLQILRSREQVARLLSRNYDPARESEKKRRADREYSEWRNEIRRLMNSPYGKGDRAEVRVRR